MGTLYHYLLIGQTDKWKNRHTDKQTAREKEQDAGVPLLLHNRKCHRHHQNGKGWGQGRSPVHGRWGDKGRGEHQFCPARRRQAGMAERRWGVVGH